MFIKVNCTACGRKLKARAELAGKKISCPSCRQLLRVPADGAVAGAEPANLIPADTADATLPPRRFSITRRSIVAIIALGVLLGALGGYFAYSFTQRPPADDDDPITQFVSNDGKESLILDRIFFGKVLPSKTTSGDYAIAPLTLAESRQPDFDRLVLVFHVTKDLMPTIEGGGKCKLVARDGRQYAFMATTALENDDFDRPVDLPLLPADWFSITCTQNALNHQGKPCNIVMAFDLPSSGTTCKLEGLQEFSAVELIVP